MDLVDQYRDKHGVNTCVKLFGVPRSSYFNRKAAEQRPPSSADDVVHDALRKIIAVHPAYGWRRLQAELFEVHGIQVNHKRLKRILSEQALALPRNVAKRRHAGPAGLLGRYEGSADLVRGREFPPLEAFSTDFTELVYGNGRKAWLMAFVDVHSKLVAGWVVDSARNRELALRSLDGLVKSLKQLGITPVGRTVHHDKDSVYTSYAWLGKLLLDLRMLVSFSENGARHNPWIESLWSRTKHECASRLAEAESLDDVFAVVDQHFNYHNHERRHSALGNMTPMGYLQREGFPSVSRD
jgi:putative transposase